MEDSCKELGIDIEVKKIQLAKLNERIDDLREILNEICCTFEDNNNHAERLAVSMALDELIVEYVKQLNKYNEKA